MKMKRRLAVLSIAGVWLISAPSAQQPLEEVSAERVQVQATRTRTETVISPPTARRLLQKADLVYAGAFRVPGEFTYGGSLLAWNPVRNTLLLTGYHDQLGEVEVPALKLGEVTSLETARIVTAPFDPFEGKRRDVSSPEKLPSNLGGVWAEGDKLYLTSFVYYDAGHVQKSSHFVRPLDFANRGQVRGPFATTAMKQAYVAGYFAPIPSEWQARLGGRILNGLCCVSIIGRTSSGASAWLIDPAQIGLVNPIPVRPLVYYPINHPIDPPRGGWHVNGGWQAGGSGGDPTYYNGSGGMGNAVWPTGTDTILFWGSTGLGEFCYGVGTTNPALHKTLTGAGGGEVYCYDPTNPYKSPHSYPYVFRVWAYDAADFKAVKDGTKQPWELLPYAWWDFDLPAPHPQSLEGTQGKSALGGVTYDPATGRILVAHMKADSPAQSSFPPVIHVFTVRP